MKKILCSFSIAFAAVLFVFTANAAVDEVMPLSAYVQDGLTFQWDGINNAGIGVHDNAATTWTELKSGLTTTIKKRAGTGFVWDDNSFVNGASDSSCFWVEDNVFKDGVNNGALTIEMFCSHTSSVQNYEDWFGVGNASNHRWLKLDIRKNDSSSKVFQGLQFRATSWNAAAVIPGNSGFEWNKPQYVAVVCTNMSGTIRALLYGNGSNLVHSITGGSTASDGVFTAGDFAKGNAILYNAHIYTVRVYNRPLSPAEIEQNRLVDVMRFDKKSTNWWAEEPSLSVESWTTAETPGRLNIGRAVCGEVSCNYTQAEIDAFTPGTYDVVFTVPSDGFHAALRKSVRVTVTRYVSAQQYVQNGLAAQWDGIENAGVGVHDSSAATWTDIKGGHTTTKFNNAGAGGSWTDNAYVNAQSSCSGFWTEDVAFKNGINGTDGARLTVELFAKHSSSNVQNYEDWLGVGNNSNNRWLKLDIRNSDSSSKVFQGLQYRVGGWSSKAIIPQNDIFKWDMPQYAGMVCDGGSVRLYGNGTNLVHTTTGSATVSDGVFTFGGFAKGGNPLRSATIYAVRVYTNKLSLTEIAYNAALDKLRFEDDDSAYNRLLLDADVSSTLDAANGKIIVSVLVKNIHEWVDTPVLKAQMRSSDGTIVTKTYSGRVTASGTPYEFEFDDLVGGNGYELNVTMADSADHVVTYPAGSIFVGEVSIAAGNDVSVANGGTGTFVVTRGDSIEATANDLVVNYTATGTAVSGLDYRTLSGSVTIPIGMSNAVINVSQLFNDVTSTDTTLTLTLAPGGYVPNPEAQTATINVIKPDYDQPWVYDGTGNTLTDGIWLFNATRSGTKITVGKLKKTYSHGLLDFTKPIEGDYTITGVGNYCLQGNTVLKALRLPETITSLGQYSFDACYSLTNVVPFLPRALTYLGDRCFRDCWSLRGDAVIATEVNSFTAEQRAFRSIPGLTSIRIGGALKNIPESFCQGCTSLTNVVLEEGVESVGINAFMTTRLQSIRLPEHSLKYLYSRCFDLDYEDQSTRTITSVEPFLPTSIEYLGNRIFGNVIVAGIGPLTLQNDYGKTITYEAGDNNGNQFEFAPCPAITVGSGVNTLANGLFYCMTSVKELRFTGPRPTSTFTGKQSPFYGWGTRQALVYIPAKYDSWIEFLEDPTYVTPWREVGQQIKDGFSTAFPGKRRPYGMSTSQALFGVQWIYRDDQRKTILIVQ